ncbi:MAG: hypothetical protein GY842_19985 [bacterium]|nr:hypothetical protein [bacterium]
MISRTPTSSVNNGIATCGENRVKPCNRPPAHHQNLRHPPPWLVVLLLLLTAGVPHTVAMTPLDSLAASPDTTGLFGGVAVRDQNVMVDDLDGGLIMAALGALPDAADVDGFHAFPDGQVLFSLDTMANIGGAVYGPADIVRYDGVEYTLEFDSNAAGLPAGVNVDALSYDGVGLLISFDTTVDLAGGPYADVDMLRWSGGGFDLFFDGSAAMVAEGLDADGAHWLSNGNLLLSFDAGGALGGVIFADEDVLEYNPGAASWEVAYDGSVAHSAWVAADLDALMALESGQVQEPGSLQFAEAVYTVLETEAVALITVTRTAGTFGSVSVSYSTGDGTAIDGQDYTASVGVLTWAAGDGTTKSFAVPILDDVAIEGTETVLLELSTPTGGAVLGEPSSAVLQIIDDEASIPLPIPTLNGMGFTIFVVLLGIGGAVLARRWVVG